MLKVNLRVKDAKEAEAYPARDDNAVSENPNKPQIPAITMTNHTAFTGVRVRLLICFQRRDPGRAPSRANANITHEASTPWAAPVTNYIDQQLLMIKLQEAIRPYLYSDDEAPDSHLPLLPSTS